MPARPSFIDTEVFYAVAANELATAIIAINAQTGTTYTFQLTDDGKLCTLSNAASITATIPPNASVAFGIGTQINVMQLSTGTATLTAGAGVTLYSDGSKFKTNAQYAITTIVKIAINTWVACGNLKA